MDNRDNKDTDKKRRYLRRYAQECDKIDRLRSRESVDPQELEDRIHRLEIRASGYKDQILEEIKILDHTRAEVIRLRYIERLSPSEISRILGYNRRHIFRLISESIEILIGVNDYTLNLKRDLSETRDDS